MAYDFVVLGATGIQGRIASRDLLESGYSVLMCGRDRKRIEPLLKRYRKTDFHYLDLRWTNRASSIIEKSGANVVLNCAEGDWNINAMKACLKSKVSYLDLGSDIPMTKEQFKMDRSFRRDDLVAITGCGSTPGVNNVMLKFASEKFDRIRSVDAGFAWSSNQDAFVVPFSVRSIVEEFVDPAAILKDGRFVKVMPREQLFDVNYRDIGPQKTFFVRHPEVYTFYRFLKGKGIKNIRFFAGFPEHSYRKILDTIELGIESNKTLNVEGHAVKASDFLAELLKELKIPKGYKEKENLWVKITGRRNGEERSMLMECIVSTMKGWEDATCNIDTGMPASIMAQMVKEGTITERGVFAPESVVPPGVFFKELARRKMAVYENGRRIN